MLRTMLLDRPGLMLLILALPISETAAGPIFTHSTGAAGTGGWIQGTRAVTCRIRHRPA